MTEQAILLNCKAGCTGQEVCDRLDHDTADLFFDPDEPQVEVNDIDNIALELPSTPALVSTATNGAVC
jgi:hypothetical protein